MASDTPNMLLLQQPISMDKLAVYHPDIAFVVDLRNLLEPLVYQYSFEKIFEIHHPQVEVQVVPKIQLLSHGSIKYCNQITIKLIHI